MLKLKKTIPVILLALILFSGCTIAGNINLPSDGYKIQEAEPAKLQNVQEIEQAIQKYHSVAIVINDDAYVFEDGVPLNNEADAQKYFKDGGYISTEAVIITDSQSMSYKIGVESKVLTVTDSKHLDIFLEEEGVKNA